MQLAHEKINSQARFCEMFAEMISSKLPSDIATYNGDTIDNVYNMFVIKICHTRIHTIFIFKICNTWIPDMQHTLVLVRVWLVSKMQSHILIASASYSALTTLVVSLERPCDQFGKVL